MLARCRLNPWIENLIGSFGRDEGKSIGPLKAHVIGVGYMSQSQALGSEDPTGLLFLSDEQVQIPAVLTASAWENLQDHEDRECFSSLLNTTVGIQDYKLQFHRSEEQTRSRFYLLVGKLVTTAVGVRDNTPCCTSLPSVRSMICQTWRAMLGQEDSEKGESMLNLTELLGEWQQDCLQAELEHVREIFSSEKPQPSTSSINSTPLPDTCTATSWDIDTVRYKGIKSFTVSVKQLIIPDNVGQQHLEPKTVSENVKTSQSKSTNLQSTLPKTGQQSTTDDVSNSIAFAPVVLNTANMSPMSNPWDICPPPSNTSSTKSTPEFTPVPYSSIFNESTSNLPHLDPSRQISTHSKGSQKLTAEPSLFPPYQRSASALPLSISSKKSANALSNMSQVADPDFSTTEETSDGQSSRKCKRSLRKRSAPPIDVTEILDEEEINSSPPSWLFDSQIGATSVQNTFQLQSPSVEQPTNVHPRVHTDGKPFSYTYQVKDQELQHFSCFTVQQDLQQWAVRYLLRPRHTEHNSTGVAAPRDENSHITLSWKLAV
ncbi:adrenocortical dysplasia protein homolog [Periophthalmus magnuspinnatus]|uniref:adrenocortical dysplasia protein homolog n=1 Tax=Periophthalmus magnuspinnatus TaxID=409849 RepID=UPI00145AAAF2|nr:adrenocortical dysplasia protein homolog [Periophthalmus magnuspinnatus]